jgi:hypothetical protein
MNIEYMERDIIFVLQEIGGLSFKEAKEDLAEVRKLIRRGKLNACAFLEDVGLEREYSIVLV